MYDLLPHSPITKHSRDVIELACHGASFTFRNSHQSNTPSSFNLRPVTNATMNDYEARRLEKIKQNQSLLAELDIKPVIKPVVAKRKSRDKPAAAKRRKIENAPVRSSARIASAPEKPIYNEDITLKPIPLPRSSAKATKQSAKAISVVEEVESLGPPKDIEDIQAGWTIWRPTAPSPERDEFNRFHFSDFEDFAPNKSPEEMIREGCFGGAYYRPLRSRKLGIVIQDDWKEDLPMEWISGLNVELYLTNLEYDPTMNKFKVACGQSIEEWEAAGWISHEHDVRGWFQWYIRFFRGRRCEDDARQVSRWKKCVGETGRWKRMLLKKYMQSGVREVFDDGEEETAEEVSPVIHQTCHHWAMEIRQEDLDAYWASGGR